MTGDYQKLLIALEREVQEKQKLQDELAELKKKYKTLTSQLKSSRLKALSRLHETQRLESSVIYWKKQAEEARGQK